MIDTSHTILFTGYFERRIRGEMLAYQLNPGSRAGVSPGVTWMAKRSL